MAPLSRALSWIVIPHDHYGNHLYNNGNTLDTDLEMKNFQYAGETFAEIWSDMKIVDFKVIAEYILIPEDVGELPEITDQYCYLNHTRERQYMFQILF